MIHWFTKNHVAANLLMLGILISGIWIAVEKLGVEVEPAYQLKRIGVKINLQGAAPEDIEKQIILPVEKALENTPGVDTIQADARNGIADIDVIAKDSANLEDLKLEIESRIQRISNIFPREIDKPRVYIRDTSNWKEVITVVVSGDFSQNDLLKAARKVRDDLQSKNGISKVAVTGIQNREISIDLIPEKLNAYGLTFVDVQKGIEQSSIDLSAGSVKSFGERVTIRSNNKAYYGEQFRKLVIKKNNESEILVEDVAVVSDSFEEGSRETLFNDRPAIMVEVMRKDGESALDIADTVHAYIEEARSTLPAGLHINAWDDDSVSLRGRINTLIWSLIQGCILVMIVLGLFLRPSVAFWVTIGIPVSFAGAAISMYLCGVTINNMSLFGFIIVLGIVVDDAIVTGESIFAKAKSGEHLPLDAAVLGTKEVAAPVTFGVITTMAAFFTLMTYDGYQGTLYKQIPFVVIPVLLFSLIESKFILPAHLKHLKPGKEKPNIISRVQDKIAESLQLFIRVVYQPFLNICIKFRYAVICAFVALLAITWSFKENKMEESDFPSVERYYLYARLNMKQGTEFEITKARMADVTQAVYNIRDQFIDEGSGESLIRGVIAVNGASRGWGGFHAEQGYLKVEITPPSLRKSEQAMQITNSEIVRAWNQEVGIVKGAKVLAIRGESNQSRHNYRDAGLQIQLRGSDEEAKGIVAEKFEAWVHQNPRLTNPHSSERKLIRELSVKLKASGSALTDKSLAAQIRTAFNGTRIERIQRGEDEINVMLRFPEKVRTSIHSLNTLRLNLPHNKTAPLTQFADIVETTTPPSITRVDGSRILDLYAQTAPGVKLIDLEQEVNEFMKSIAVTHPSVSWKLTGTLADYRQQKKETNTLFWALILSLFALLAIPFKSFLQPFYVLLAVPFGIVGAVWGHYIMGLEITKLSYLGILALAGVVVNDSLVLVDYINQKRLEGMPLHAAVMRAGGRRFRPIILTSITTFAGLLPLLFENSIQAQFLIPMATSLGFGILFATVITLLLIPCCYMIGEEIKAGLFRCYRWFIMKSPDSEQGH